MLALPTSYSSLCLLTAVGWFGATPQAGLVTKPVQKAVQKFVQRVTFPAFIFQTLSYETSSASLLVYCTVIASVSLVAHLTVTFIAARHVFSKRTARDRLLLSSLSSGHENEGLSVAFCAVLWGSAGAKAAAVAACTSAVLGPLASWLSYGATRVGLPQDVKHRDGGVYNGEWSQGKKDGYGVYSYASGAKYEGAWKANMKHGHGVFHYAGGGSFEGQFVKGKRSGVGVRLWPHGAAKAAVFDQDKMVERVELADAAQTMYRASQAGAAARAVITGGLTLTKAAKASFFSAPVAAVLFLAAAALFVPVPDAAQQALTVASSVHIPLVLVLFGANLPSQRPETRHATSIRSVLAIRQLTALVIGMLLLIATPQTVEHAMSAAAVLCCLLSPMSRQALELAAEFKLNSSLLNSVTASSYFLSGLCMCLIAFTAWCRDLVPIFTSLAHAQASTFPLLDMCLFLIAVLSAAAVFLPRMLVKKVVKMTVSAEDFLKSTQTDPPNPEPPQTARAAAAGAVAVGTHSNPLHTVRFSTAHLRKRSMVASCPQQSMALQKCRTAKLRTF